MDANLQVGTATLKEASPTLGELLYNNATRSRTSEKEWVALVRAVAAGDTSVFGTLYMWTQGIIFTSIVKITGNRAAAEELTIEVFHAVWRDAATYDPAVTSVVGWVMNLARSRALVHQRVDRGKRAASMRAAVQKLTTGEHRAIEDAYFSGLTYVELAAREGILPTIFKARIRSGLGRLRTLLTPGYGKR